MDNDFGRVKIIDQKIFDMGRYFYNIEIKNSASILKHHTALESVIDYICMRATTKSKRDDLYAQFVVTRIIIDRIKGMTTDENTIGLILSMIAANTNIANFDCENILSRVKNIRDMLLKTGMS